MNFITTDTWNDELWDKANQVYEEAFGRHGAKSTSVIRNMFARQMCSLHIVFDEAENDSEVIGMAITAELKPIRSLVIDYLAIKKTYRNKGKGEEFVHYLRNWAVAEKQCDSIILEIEATDDPVHQLRIKFWEKCGFHLTEYIHDYKVVPEPYQAMYQKLSPQSKISTDGRELFKYLSNFHRLCFRGVKNNDD